MGRSTCFRYAHSCLYKYSRVASNETLDTGACDQTLNTGACDQTTCRSQPQAYEYARTYIDRYIDVDIRIHLSRVPLQ